MKNKLEVLKKIAYEFNKDHIRWALGASALLFLKGIVEEFHDIDIMIDDYDADKAIYILDKLGRHIDSPTNNNFGTKHFLEYIIDDVEIDCMGGFSIIKENIEYDCSLKQEHIIEYYNLDNIDIPLYSLNEWRKFYDLMGRENKVKIIDDYFKKSI